MHRTSPSDDVIRFIVNTVEPRTVHVFLEGLQERATSAAADPTSPAVDELATWVAQWYVSARLINDPEWVAADDAVAVGPPVSGSELRARVMARRRAAIPA